MVKTFLLLSYFVYLTKMFFKELKINKNVKSTKIVFPVIRFVIDCFLNFSCTKISFSINDAILVLGKFSDFAEMEWFLMIMIPVKTF